MKVIDRQATGAHIRSLMGANGMDTKYMAKELEMSCQAVNSFLKGKSLPKLNRLLRMSDMFGISLNELVIVDKKKFRKLMKQTS